MSVKLASLKERKKSIFDRVWFSMKTVVLEGAAMYTGSISHVDNNSDIRRLESVLTACTRVHNITGWCNG